MWRLKKNKSGICFKLKQTFCTNACWYYWNPVNSVLHYALQKPKISTPQISLVSCKIFGNAWQQLYQYDVSLICNEEINQFDLQIIRLSNSVEVLCRQHHQKDTEIVVSLFMLYHQQTVQFTIQFKDKETRDQNRVLFCSLNELLFVMVPGINYMKIVDCGAHHHPPVNVQMKILDYELNVNRVCEPLPLKTCWGYGK